MEVDITWLSSLNGAIAVSIIALMSLVGRSFLDARFVLTEDMPNASKAMVGGWALFTMVLVGGWVWVLVAAAQGSRAGLIGAAIIALLVGLLGGAASLIAFRPIMPSAKPLGDIAIWSNMFFGLLAALLVGLRLRG
jgi:hypothetical protein